MRLSFTEMLEQWLLRHCLEPPVGVTSTDINGDAAFVAVQTAMMTDWYARLLDDADPRYIPPCDISRSISLSDADRAIILHLPEGCRKIIELRIKGAGQPVEIVAPGSRRAKLARSPFPQTSASAPVAVASPSVDIMALYISPSTKAADVEIESATAVMRPPEGMFDVTEAALAAIPSPI